MSSSIDVPEQVNAPISDSYRPYSKNAKVIGIYGLPGSGKTFLLNHLKHELGPDFAFYEGSEMIDSLVPGGLDAFKELDEQRKVQWRERAINEIEKKAVNSNQVAVVVGHFMFWLETDDVGHNVCTQQDLKTFTHIIYLDVPAQTIAQRRLYDIKRGRSVDSDPHLHRWQDAEKTQLRQLCLSHNILFTVVSSDFTTFSTTLCKVRSLLCDFKCHTESYNLSRAYNEVDKLVVEKAHLRTVLVFDADKTLAAEDTGKLFWNKMSGSPAAQNEDSPLSVLFDSQLQYSHTAFRQATLLYEEAADDQKFNALCEEVSSMVNMYPDILSLLQLVEEQESVGVVIITSGLGLVWQKVIQKAGLSGNVKVIGSGRLADGLVVTAEVKAALVARLHDAHRMCVWAFGDGPLDLKMLGHADHAIVVVGDEQSRSRSMEAALLDAIDNQNLQACQVLIPNHVTPRLNTTQLPLVRLTDQAFVDAMLHDHRHPTDVHVLTATGKHTAKLLMTPMRDSINAGPVLRKAHHDVGWYLGMEFLTDVIGIEEYLIRHVQGHKTRGFRLFQEKRTLIVALMRGGEPMALGVNEAFPLASFLHAKQPGDIMTHHLQGQTTVLLVDSVVSTGATVVEFVERIRELHATILVVVVAGVVQSEALSVGHKAETLRRCGNLKVVALRLSDNKFAGRGGTDTGNRLFNTTYLP